MKGNCKIELQKNMKPVSLGLDTTKIYYNDANH